MTRNDSLTELVNEIRACQKCVMAPVKETLPHEPRPVLQVSNSARLCICGQAPGTRVHASGKPFTDPSGDRLRDWMGVNEEEFYDERRLSIVPMGFCFPGLDAKGGDLPPRPECAPLWRDRLFSHLPHLELILLLGQHAQKWHLGGRKVSSLTETVKDWRSVTDSEDLPRFLPLPHPSWRNNAWLKRNPWFELELIPFLRKEVRRLL